MTKQTKTDDNRVAGLAALAHGQEFDFAFRLYAPAQPIRDRIIHLREPASLARKAQRIPPF